MLRKISFLLYAGILTGCATLDEDRKKSPYYSDERFQNIDNDEGIREKSIWTLFKWKFFTKRDADVIAGVSDTPPQTKKITPQDLLAPQNKIRITWIGHATAFISVNKGGSIVNILTDPIFGGIFTVSRLTEMPLLEDQLPRVDVVVVSHSHYDHCDLDALRFLQKQNPEIKIIFPEGQKAWGVKNGLTQAEEMRWWTKQKIGNVDVHFLPSHHWSVRVPADRMQFHWGSYAFAVGKAVIYFAGDTAYSSHFKLIAEKFPQGFSAALMPIGAYAPRWFMKASHVDPRETVVGSQDLKAKIILPVHWATFRQSDEKIMEPIYYLKREAEAKKAPYKHWLPGEAYEVDIR